VSTAAVAGWAVRPVRDQAGAHAPRAAPLATAPRVAWVFSSGGPRAFVHVGVLKALERLGLAPDLVVGASAGAWIAVLHAAGLDAAAIERAALAVQPWQLLRFALGAPETFSADPIAELVREQAGVSDLRELQRPAACAVQRLDDGEVLAFNAGDAGLAVQAATAVEGRIAPVLIDGRRYGDADLRMPLPVRLARALGAARVLAVDASAHEGQAPPGTEQWRAGDLRKRALTRPDAALADLLLHPDTGYYAGMSGEYRRHCIAIGERSTLEQAEALRRLHS
jgi:NTE family protein